MAERSFAREVEDLKLGAGEVFRGEGILAITKALLQSGVSYVGGYQGSPISHLMDVLADAKDVLDELGVHFETSASEATAAATLSASVMYPLRGAVTWKSTAGTNVAADALSNLSSGGVTGGAMIIIGEDYGEGSSIMQERSHAYALKSQIWLIDPRPNLPTLVRMVEEGFELSEASNTPVMLEVRIRTCHVHGQFVAKDNQKPKFTLREALENPVRDVSRIVLPPASFLHEREKLERRRPAAIEFVKAHKLNEIFGPARRRRRHRHARRHVQYDACGRWSISASPTPTANSAVPLYVLNVAYPLIEDELVAFCAGKRAVLDDRGGRARLHRARSQHDPAPARSADESQRQRRAADGRRIHGAGADQGDYASFWPPMRASCSATVRRQPDPSPVLADPRVKALAEVVPAAAAGVLHRLPGAADLRRDETGGARARPASRLRRHRLPSVFDPAAVQCRRDDHGLWPRARIGVRVQRASPTSARSRCSATAGSGTTASTSSIGNAVFNKHDGVTLIVDNFYSAATGGQDIPSSRASNPRRKTNNSIVAAVRGVGAKWVRQIDRTYDVAAMRDTLREALTSKDAGAEDHCRFLGVHAEQTAPRSSDACRGDAPGKRVVREKFGVDADICTGDHACIRLSGCPSLVA